MTFMRITVTIPDGIYRSSHRLAQRLGLSRSALYGRALEEYVDHHQGDAFVNPLIRAIVEPVLIEEMSRLTPAASNEASAPPISHDPARTEDPAHTR